MTTQPGTAGDPPILPELPERAEPALLRGVDESALDEVEAGLRAAERATIVAMSPWERQLREVRARLAEVATERRRRERSAKHAARQAVRAASASGAMPSLADALAGAVTLPAERPLAALRAFLGTGGEVGFGFPTRPGTVAFTDGRSTRQAKSWGDAASAWADGWEPGTPGVPGVRVHLAGTRIERVVPPGDVLIDAGPVNAEPSDSAGLP